MRSTSARPSRTKVALWVAAALAVVAAGRYLDAPALLRAALDWIRDLGPWGPVIFVLLYIAATVLLLPGSVLTLGAGAVFGLVKGAALVSVAATLGATAAFVVGRYLAREWVAGKIERYPRFAAIDRAVAREGWKIVGLTRLSPVFPFNLLNYAFGLTRVSLRDYFFASWIGMMPGTVMYVYVGSLAGDLAALGAGSRARTPAEWTLYLVGLLATVAVTVYVTRLARAALARRGAAA
jgi:uncharacterized membrane protein YdjX (TVP38/TMEM64 family)